MTHVRADSVVRSALRDAAAGLRDADNAAKHGVAVKTIRRWRREYVRLARLRGQGHTTVECPRCGDGVLNESAYAELFGWYLGDGHITESRRGVFTLQVVNDVRYPGLNVHLRQVMRGVKPGGRPHQRLRPGAVMTSLGWKHWPCLFPQHGRGRKHERELGMQDWQWEIVERHPGDFLRGLFHADGCRVHNWATRVVGDRKKRYDYPRWQFVNHSEDILDWCSQALDLVDVPWRRSSWKTISVSTRSGVARLDDIVGPKH